MPLPPRPSPSRAPQAPRSSAPPPAVVQKAAARMLVRLDEMLRRTADLGANARERVGVGGLNRYRRFTKKVRDFFALASVVEEKLAPLDPGLAAPLLTALDRLHARMVLLFIEESAGFFASFMKVQELPIGTHEICGVELRGLVAIRGFLDDPRYDGERGQALRAKADRIADMMRAVMARIPPLPDFGDLPSVGPKGAINKPVKPPRRPPPRPQAAAPPPPPAAAPEPPPVPEVRQLTLDDFKD